MREGELEYEEKSSCGAPHCPASINAKEASRRIAACLAVGRHCTALRTEGMSPSLMPVEVIRGWSLLLWSLSKIAQQTPYYEWLDAWRQPVGNGRYFDLQRSASALVQNIQFSHWHQLCFQTHPLAVRLARVEHPLVWYRRNSVQADSKKIEIPISALQPLYLCLYIPLLCSYSCALVRGPVGELPLVMAQSHSLTKLERPNVHRSLTANRKRSNHSCSLI